MERNFSRRPVVTGQEVMASNRKRVDLDWIQGRNLFNEGCETVQQVVQRNCGHSTKFQGQGGWGFEQLGPVEIVLAHGRGIGTR